MPEDTPFELQTFLPYLLNQAAESSSYAFQKIYKGRYGMLRTEWRVLFHLGLFGRLTASQITARASIHKTKISRAVHALEARRFLHRQRDPDDKRQEYLVLSAAGQKAYQELKEVAKQHDQYLTQNFTAQEIDTVKRALVALAKISD